MCLIASQALRTRKRRATLAINQYFFGCRKEYPKKHEKKVISQEECLKNIQLIETELAIT